MDDGHALAREQLAEIVEASEGTIELLGEEAQEATGCVLFDVTLPFQGAKRVESGLPINARERFLIRVSDGFPFVQPIVRVPHPRFAGFPHVQWGRQLCLYQSSADWKPENGMYGLVSRLDDWVRDAALDELDPDDAPLHPPVEYPSCHRLVVPVADAPEPGSEPWYGFAALRQRGSRTEIVDWVSLDGARPQHFAAAILLHEPLPFEYPQTVRGLFDELERHGVRSDVLIWLLATLALETAAGMPLLVVLGTPMRRVTPGGPLLTHLAAWEIAADAADDLRRLNALLVSQGRFKAMGQEALKKVVKWAVQASVGWCRVRESRQAVTKRRDQESATTWFADKVVELWGCGAIGSHVAESLARADVGRLVLRDNSIVVPGILVRQAFDDENIGEWKPRALKDRVLRIQPDLDVDAQIGDLLDLIDESTVFDGPDIILDCTGSASLRLKLERRIRGGPTRPPIVSMGVSYDAKAAVATLCSPSHSGGPSDVLRRLKLQACRDPDLNELRDAFWPAEPRRDRFQPEPGCSEPTFVGSNADLAGLSARMLNAVAEELTDPGRGRTAAGWLFRATGELQTYRWRADTVVDDGGNRYEVRVVPAALREMRGWARTSRRKNGPGQETGGLIFGELNEAAGVVWVTDVEGPPPDSDASEQHFTCGVAGMADANAEKEKRFQGAVSCIGSWHTHPTSPAKPSNVDIEAILQLLGDPDSNRRTCLLLILSGTPERPTLGAHAFRTVRRTDKTLTLEMAAAATTPIEEPEPPPRDVGLTFSGGGSRAVAFHLGCLRALNDLDLLGRVQVISGVSGGSVLAAMYAYSDDAFADFDARVVKMLRRGLAGDIVCCWLTPRSLMKTVASVATNVPLSLLRVGAQLLPRKVVVRFALLDSKRPPPGHYFSRSEAFRAALARTLFGERRVIDVERPGLNVVINATDLRTGSAFRFGSQGSGCWRLGTIPDEEAIVADAVTASAAYPVFLPTLEREYTFTHKGQTRRDRAVLTDGGVFENLGVSPMEPGRDPTVSTNVFAPAFIISCDAGTGLFDDDSFPRWWPSRMYRSFETTFRKVQDATRKRLHQLAADGHISGFVFSYLGQSDRALPWKPADLPPREEVYQYPTDLSSMADEDIERLAQRGERLTRFLVSYYLADL